MPQVHIFDSVFAVTDEPDEKTLHLLGTAFSVGGNAFATAGHVVEALAESKRPALRMFLDTGETKAIPILKSEKWGSVDFGLIEADFEPNTYISWFDTRIAAPTDVWTIGFGFGHDMQRQKLSMRHFKGHLVSQQKYASWEEFDPTRAGVTGYEFWVYELSFACPKGQSGSPLLTRLPDGTFSLVGVVVANGTRMMNLVTHIEEQDDGSHTERFEAHDVLHLGQAIASPSLLGGASTLLANLRTDAPDPEKKRVLGDHLGKEMVRQVAR